MIRKIILLAVLLLLSLLAASLYITKYADVKSPPVLLEDNAGLFGDTGASNIIDYHQVLLSDYDIDYRVITTNTEQDLNLYSAKKFEVLSIGNMSESGRGLLLAINPESNRVRLEVGRNLEGIYVDSFIAFIEQHQMVPFFRKNRVADGILATTELIITRAQEAMRSSDLDTTGKTEKSMGAGAITDANIGVEDTSPSPMQPDVRADGSPIDTVSSYIRAMEAGNSRSDLEIYSQAAQKMLNSWVVTKAQMRNVVRDHRRCKGERFVIDGDKAVVQYDAKPGVCSPYFLRREEGKWRIDFAYMQKYIRFDTDNQWHMPWGAKEFAFAFPQKSARTSTGNHCRWCFTFRNEDMVIISIDAGSASEQMGLQEGDKILQVGDMKNPGMRQVFNFLYEVKEGEIVKFLILRGDETHTFTFPAPAK